MKNIKKYIWIYILVILIVVFIFSRYQNIKNKNIISGINTNNTAQENKDISCARGEPEEEFDDTKLKEHSFVLDKKTGEAIEKSTFSDNTSFMVRNYGCEYFNLEFTIKFPLEGHHVNDVGFWYTKTGEYFAKIGKVTKVFDRDMANISKALESYSLNNKKLEYNESLNLSDTNNDIQQTITIDEPTISEGFINITATYSIGPL